ncbi:unnamed protein product [Pedinophyceae sp. YPF-701]|nr:unnamed protein product [Pedinophyceae sp. YPF-701]
MSPTASATARLIARYFGPATSRVAAAAAAPAAAAAREALARAPRDPAPAPPAPRGAPEAANQDPTDLPAVSVGVKVNVEPDTMEVFRCDPEFHDFVHGGERKLRAWA